VVCSAGLAGELLGGSCAGSPPDAGQAAAGIAGSGAVVATDSVAASGSGLAAVASGWGLAAVAFGPPATALASGCAMGSGVSGGAVAASGSASAAAVLARALDAAVFDRVPAAFLGRAPGAVFACGLAAAFFDRAPDDVRDRVPAAGLPAAAPVLSAEAGGASASVASALAWLRPAAGAFAACTRPPARAWPGAWASVLADCLLAARRGAGSVPFPAESSPGSPFSEVTAP
jgi:hypothetical protein